MTDVESGATLCDDCKSGPLCEDCLQENLDDDKSLCDDCEAQENIQVVSGSGQAGPEDRGTPDTGVRRGTGSRARPGREGRGDRGGRGGGGSKATNRNVENFAAATGQAVTPELAVLPHATSHVHPNSNVHRPPRFLFAFDFDHTIIDANSDLVIQEVHQSGPIPERVKIVAKEQGWTTFMQEVFRFHYTNNVTREQFCSTLNTIPLVPGVLECMKALKKAGGELIVVSDANTFFISHILEFHGVLPIFAHIIANPAEFDPSGQLLIAPYHNNMTCNLSSRNLCKGKVLEEYIQTRKAAGVFFEFICFAGDGINDFCPMLKLSSNDIAFAREGFSICQYIERMARDEHMLIRAKKSLWTDGAEITKVILERLSQSSPQARKCPGH